MTLRKRIGGALIGVFIEGGKVDTPASGFPVRLADGPQLDAFGRERVSEPQNRADIEFIYNKQPDLIDEVTAGAGTATFNSSSRDITLAVVDDADGSSAALYSYDVPYTPGNSQLIDITGTLDNAGIGDGEAFVFLRSPLVDGGELAIAQSAWNGNTVLDVDWATSQIFSIDFQSLKVGRIRFALVRDGVAVGVHEIYNDNQRVTGYWQLPSLPFFWHIYNDATYTYMEIGYGDIVNAMGFRYRIAKKDSATMRAICATVKSEGGESLFDLPGFQRSIDNGVTTKTVSNILVPLLSIRPAALYNSITNRGLYIPTGYDLKANQDIRYVILYRPTLTGASWVSVDALNSGVEYDITASAVTGGIQIDSDYGGSSVGNRFQTSSGLLGRTLLILGRTGISDILTVAAIRSTNSDAEVLSALKWKEIR